MTRPGWAALAGVGGLGLGLLVTPLVGWVAGGPAAVASGAVICVLAGLPWSRKWVSVIALSVAATSLATTGWALASDYRGSRAAGLWGLVELGALLLLLVLVVRWGTGVSGIAAAVATAAAQMTWIARFIADQSLAALLGGLALWGAVSLAAVVVGGYLRIVDRRLQRTVADARQRQRRQLERDLHDYVAHDLSGIIVQAQAAQYAAQLDPARLLQALQRIERAGHKAMSSVDRALELLRDEAGETGSAAPSRSPLKDPTLDELPTLVRQFQESTDAEVLLHMPGDLDEIPRVVGVTLYRVAVEALTNIRRHAPGARSVSIGLEHETTGDLTLTVRDDARRGDGPAPGVRARRSAGTGLANLAARVEALGGTLTAGATDVGWLLVAQIPGNRIPHEPRGQASS